MNNFHNKLTLSREEQLRRMEWRECIICKEHFEVLEQHIIDEHFRGSADNALAKWLIACKREYFSKYPNYGYSRRKIGFNIDDLWEPKKKKYFPGRRRVMNSSTKCNHRPINEIENKLYPDYDDGLYQRMYIELKEKLD